MSGAPRTEANEKFEYQNSLMHPVVAREILSTVLGGIDLTPYPFDGPLPDESADDHGSQSIVQICHRPGRRRTS